MVGRLGCLDRGEGVGKGRGDDSGVKEVFGV